MMMKKALPVLSAALLLAGSTASLHAAQALTPPENTRNSTFSLRGSVGYLNGQGDELVYDQGAKLSELNWELQGLVMAGITASLDAKLLRINAGVWSVLNEGNGKMYDYDWLIEGTSEWSDRSISDVIVNDGIIADINVSVPLAEFKSAELCLLLGAKYNNWVMDDWGGEYVYSANGFRDSVGTFGDTVAISYEQEFFVPYAGAELLGQTRTLGWNAYVIVSPLVIANDWDHHILRTEVSPDGIHFEESFEGGFCLGAGCSVSMDLSDSIFIAASLDFQSIPEFEGDTTIQETGEFSEDSAGIANTFTMVSAAVGLRL